MYKWLSMYIMTHLTVFKSPSLLFFIHSESIMKIRALLKKYWIYFEEDSLHSSKALLPGVVFHNLEVGTLSRFVIKSLSVSREHTYLSRRGLGCRSGSALQDKWWDLFISGKVLEVSGRLIFYFEYTFPIEIILSWWLDSPK